MNDSKTIVEAMLDQTTKTHTLLDGVNHQFSLPVEAAAPVLHEAVNATAAHKRNAMTRRDLNEYRVGFDKTLLDFCTVMMPDASQHYFGEIQGRGGMYFSPNPLKHVPSYVARESINSPVVEYRCVWFEIDPVVHPKNDIERDYVRREQQELIRRMIESLSLPEPTYSVWSGNKSTHVFWRLAEPIKLKQWLAIQKGLLLAFSGDPVALVPSSTARFPLANQTSGQLSPSIIDEPKIIVKPANASNAIHWSSIADQPDEIVLSSMSIAHATAFNNIMVTDDSDFGYKMFENIISGRYRHATSALINAETLAAKDDDDDGGIEDTYVPTPVCCHRPMIRVIQESKDIGNVIGLSGLTVPLCPQLQCVSCSTRAYEARTIEDLSSSLAIELLWRDDLDETEHEFLRKRETSGDTRTSPHTSVIWSTQDILTMIDQRRSDYIRGVAGDRCEGGNNCGRTGCPECQQ